MENVLNPVTKMVELKETACGEAILTLKRGNETQQLVIAETGLSEVVYESTIDYYMDNFNWTQEQFDHYWGNGGEDKEINSYIEAIVDNYDDNSMWEELQ